MIQSDLICFKLTSCKKCFSPRVLKILKIQSFGQKIDFKPVKYFFKPPSKRFTNSSSMEPRGPFKSELNSIHIACKSIGRKEFFTNQTKFAIMPILTSKALLCEKNPKCHPPVGVEPGPLIAFDFKCNTLLSTLT